MKHNRNEYHEFQYPDMCRDYAQKGYKRSIWDNVVFRVAIGIIIALAFGALAGSGF